MTLKELEIQRMTFLEQLKVMKFQERTEIESIFKNLFSEHVEIDWYDDDENYFRILTGDFSFEKLTNTIDKLNSNWKSYIKAYDNDCIEIEFDRKVIE